MNRKTRTPPDPVIREVTWEAGPRADKTRNLILETSNRLFLERGYNCVRVEDITDAAEMSRATFYVYFPSKRDAFLALGIDSIRAANAVIDALDRVPPIFDDSHIRTWITVYLDYLEHFGAFIRSWDEAMASDLQLQSDSHHNVELFCRRLGLSMNRLRDRPSPDVTLQGLALRSLIDGVWYFWRVSDLPHERDEIVATLLPIVKQHLS